MSEDQVSPDPTSVKAKQQPNPTIMLLAVVLAGVISFGLLVWAQGLRTAAARRDAFARGIDGLSAAMALPIIETGSQQFENRGQRLQSLVERVQKAGNYNSVVVTDKDGKVLATTDTGQQGQTVTMKPDPTKTGTVVKDVDGVLEATSPVFLDGSDKVGTLIVKAKL